MGYISALTYYLLLIMAVARSTTGCVSSLYLFYFIFIYFLSFFTFLLVGSVL